MSKTIKRVEYPASDWTRTILDSISDGVFTVDCNMVITSFNRAAEEITGVRVDLAIGRPCCEVFRSDLCESVCPLKHSLRSGEQIVNQTVCMTRADGTSVPISVSSSTLNNANGEVIGGVETFRDLSLVTELRRHLQKEYTCGDIISRSHRMRDLLSTLPDIAASGCAVLIEGESGTGKELFARSLHAQSKRCHQALVSVNCGALPDALLESELFGHMKGAFTDAKFDREGRFKQADGGTLFLDEIGETSPAMQVGLLRVLQEGTYEPLGSSKPRKADVRIIAATNRSLEEQVAAGRFREDLYYRINVVRLELPPLRERKEDVPLLIRHFVDRINMLHERTIPGVSHEALCILMNYEWPGNIRELENVIEHSSIVCGNNLIRPEHLPQTLRGKTHRTWKSGQTLAEIESAALVTALERNNWQRSATAEELGIDKTTLWRKIKRLGINVPDSQADCRMQ